MSLVDKKNISGDIPNNLRRLIFEYRSAVRDALVLLQRAGVPMPHSSGDWIDMRLLGGDTDGAGFRYYKHGAGCEVISAGRNVDFDFGRNGEIGLFDAWKLMKFAGSDFGDYGFKGFDDLHENLESLVASGFVVRNVDGQCSIFNESPIYAIDVDGRLPEDRLPLQTNDEILTLHNLHFLSADLMLKNCDKIRRKRNSEGRLTNKKRIEFRIYVSTWLGFLRAICEGFEKIQIRMLLDGGRPEEFKELIVQADLIGKLGNRHRDALRDFRNNTFHPKVDQKKRRDFFSAEEDRVSWARDLHSEIAKFFSSYRVLCEVHYYSQNRLGESLMRQEVSRRRNRSEV